MMKHLKRHRHAIAATGLLMFVAGCAGAVQTTADQLGEDIAAPVVVPIREGTKAIDKLENIDAAQAERNRQMEELGD